MASHRVNAWLSEPLAQHVAHVVGPKGMNETSGENIRSLIRRDMERVTYQIYNAIQEWPPGNRRATAFYWFSKMFLVGKEKVHGFWSRMKALAVHTAIQRSIAGVAAIPRKAVQKK